MANGNKRVRQLNDLRGPMGQKLNEIQKQLLELQRYRELFGRLDDNPDSDDDNGTEREEAGSWSNHGVEEIEEDEDEDV